MKGQECIPTLKKRLWSSCFPLCECKVWRSAAGETEIFHPPIHYQQIAYPSIPWKYHLSLFPISSTPSSGPLVYFRYQADRWLSWDFGHEITEFDLDILTGWWTSTRTKTLFRKEVDSQINLNAGTSSEILSCLSSSCI